METALPTTENDRDIAAMQRSRRFGRPNNLMWNMTRKCNFRCSYCYFPHDASPVTETLPVQRILELLDANPPPEVDQAQDKSPCGNAWVVGLTGGEPLLYPGFIDICLALTRKHCIGLDSNLSVSSKVREFAERIDPARVAYIYASLHIEERERVKGVDAFIANVVLLQERGFKVIVNSVLHPTLVDRFPADREYFARRGVEIIPRPFKGEYDGRRYPEAYGPEVRAIFAAHPQAGEKMVYNFKGVPCHGGMTFTRLEPDGTVLRCSGDKTRMGNVRETVRLNTGPLPCEVTKCPCRGLDWVVLSPEQEAFTEGLRLAVIGEREAARQAWEHSLSLNPDMSNAVNNLGVLDWGEGRSDEARKRFRHALKIHPGHELYAANLEKTARNIAPRLSNEVAPNAAGCRPPGSDVSGERSRKSWDVPACVGEKIHNSGVQYMTRKAGTARIIYTIVDEAPGLATRSFLPVVAAYAGAAGINVETRDISLSGRIIAKFPERLSAEQRVPDDLTELGELVRKPEANIIKLPNISASIPQLKAAIRELQGRGYDLPDYPDEPKTSEEQRIKAVYDSVKGSAVNPVLREGNSDRRAPDSVKNFARTHPHSMGAWSNDSRSHVASMKDGDFRSSERSVTIDEAGAGNARIEFLARDGGSTTLKEVFALTAGDIVDAAVMRRKALRKFLAEQIADARQQDLLFSVHLKATMMKVSDPVIFGHVVSVFFQDVFARHADALAALSVDPGNGLGDLFAKVGALPEEQRAPIEADIQEALARGPKLAMVDSDKGITNLHVPSDVIIDASMPAAIRSSGRMWGPDGKPHDTKFVIPDSSYAGVYQAVIDDCKAHGAYDPTTMGTVPNVGLMARKAEEYGSHDKTFPAPGEGVIRIVAASGEVLLEQKVEQGDIWRACQTRDVPIRDWVKLAVNRARVAGWTTVFWLDDQRAHDRELIAKVRRYLSEHDTTALDIRIMAPAAAAKFSVERMRAGENTISVTGNVLRDYLTDLFPILEVGTSAKMLSIVPLISGGGLFETGAGGSAPKHVQQFLAEGHLRWDSLGEFLALAASLEHLGIAANNPGAKVLADTLDRANGRFLENNKSPSRKCGEIDTRGSHFYLALYWAQELARQQDNPELQARFAPLASLLEQSEARIAEELLAAQGRPVDMGGYYRPDDGPANTAMRPSPAFNAALESLKVCA